ncbi:MAG: type II CAAX endopeptidase family protein [Pseudomonadota bacterium]
MGSGQINLRTLLWVLGLIIPVEAAVIWLASPRTGWYLLYLGLARLIEAAGILLLLVRSGPGLSAVGLSGNRLARGFRTGLIWSACFCLAAAAGLFFLNMAGLNPRVFFQVPFPKTFAGVLLYFLVGGLVSPVTEELFFRGVLYGFFRRWGATAALVASTAAFVLVHTPQIRWPVTQLVGGIVFALSYEVSKSLAVPITVHILGNLGIFSLALYFR